ncbi:MAG: RNA-binding protein [Bacteroidetes bacterium]|nr:RNA-binding protein [Bacteroidota bacterium]MBU2584754.1 RNA-binding protein [Bacteroidota bacterium]
MSKKLFVGSLPFSVSNEELQKLFETYGEVTSAVVIKDKQTRRSKGYGFVEMASDEAADAAMEALNKSELDGRNIVVNEAKSTNEDKSWKK